MMCLKNCVNGLVFIFVLTFCFTLSVSENEGEDEEWEEEEPEKLDYRPTKASKTISFSTAQLTEEDSHSMHMPDDLRCDGCRAISYVMTQKLKKIQNRYKKGHRLLESDVIDLLDQVCADNVFDDYGFKEVDGVRRLSGEGLETKDSPAIMQGGGRWPHRLKEMCSEYVGEHGEDTIYDMFFDGESLEKLFCHNVETGYICDPKKLKSKKSKEEL